ncbi:MAG TPA: imidazole glycerol phosphate synthase subunit HisH [Steroidobacteraceae bacterium]|jgi:glutamine amidotransferase|nr:imidazole glycerol phosphate synthase subunit HisH [Steroidobacteraceae bacterium]
MSAARNQLREVVIIASGGANTASLQFALERLGASSVVAADAKTIRSASHVILPGVGAAADAMSRLRRQGLNAVIPSLQQPVLGVCLGMQLLYEASEEGCTNCLGIIPGRASRFAPRADRPVPHMGWNTLGIERPCPLLEGMRPGDYAYFVHSYSLALSSATIASSNYGDPFSACVQWRNFYGAQFHPERSAKVGARLLENFLRL